MRVQEMPGYAESGPLSMPSTELGFSTVTGGSVGVGVGVTAAVTLCISFIPVACIEARGKTWYETSTSTMLVTSAIERTIKSFFCKLFSRRCCSGGDDLDAKSTWLGYCEAYPCCIG